jgi:hypothetical protein
MGIHLTIEISQGASDKINPDNYSTLIKRLSRYASENIDSLIVNEDDLKASFEIARKLYPGTKRGLETEFNNLKKKHKDWSVIVPVLFEQILNQISWRRWKNGRKEFVPEWKNLQTWINNRCWEDELEGDWRTKQPVGYMPVMDQNMAMEFGKDVPIAKVPIYEPKPGMWRLDDPRLKDLPIKELVKI